MWARQEETVGEERGGRGLCDLHAYHRLHMRRTQHAHHTFAHQAPVCHTHTSGNYLQHAHHAPLCHTHTLDFLGGTVFRRDYPRAKLSWTTFGRHSLADTLWPTLSGRHSPPFHTHLLHRLAPHRGARRGDRVRARYGTIRDTARYGTIRDDTARYHLWYHRQSAGTIRGRYHLFKSATKVCEDGVLGTHPVCNVDCFAYRAVPVEYEAHHEAYHLYQACVAAVCEVFAAASISRYVHAFAAPSISPYVHTFYMCTWMAVYAHWRVKGDAKTQTVKRDGKPPTQSMTRQDKFKA